MNDVLGTALRAVGACAALLCLPALAFNSGSTGADGDLSPPASQTTTVTLPDNGILNYNTVTIPAGATVKFARNTANTPVYLLVKGNATIAGTIDVSGGAAYDLVNHTIFDGVQGVGGPGGFDGGKGGGMAPDSMVGGAGQGPGGGSPGDYSYCSAYGTYSWGGGGGGNMWLAGNPDYARTNPSCSSGAMGLGGAKYGSANLDPLIGGSGGGGGGGGSITAGMGAGGGGGGGAILIAVSGTLSMPGGAAVKANGGKGGDSSSTGYGGGGAGGAIRIIASGLNGAPSLSTAGGAGNGGYVSGAGAGAYGRIRVEADSGTFSGGSYNPAVMTCTGTGANPCATGAMPTLPGTAAGASLPSVRFSKVDGQAIAVGQVLTGSGDIVLSSTRADPTTVTVELTTANVPLAANPVATITLKPERGTPVTYSVSTWSGTDAGATGSSSLVKLPLGRNVLSAALSYTN